MSAEFPKAEVAPAESKEEKMARLRAELAALETPEEPAQAPEAQAETPVEAAQEPAAETVAASDPAAAERAAADEAALVATRERLGMIPTAESAEQTQPPSVEELRSLLELRDTSYSGGGYSPVVEAALAQQGVKDPERQGDTRPESIEKYKDAKKAKATEMFRNVVAGVTSSSPEAQKTLAQQYFSEMGVGQNTRGTQDAYRTYLDNFRGTPFGEEFKRLESDRLVKAGYAPLGADF